MTEMIIDVKGLREVNKALYSYSRQLGDKVVLAALRQGANVIAKQLRATLPDGKTHALKKGVRVARSKINNGRKNPGVIGVYIRMKKGTARSDPLDPFYERFLDQGYNVRGPSRSSKNTFGRGGKLSRAVIRAAGLSRGRTSLPGKTNYPAQKYFDRAFSASSENAARVAVRAVEIGAELVARRTGLK